MRESLSSVSVPGGTADLLREIAAERGTTVSKLVRKAIARVLTPEERKRLPKFGKGGAPHGNQNWAGKGKQRKRRKPVATD